MVTLAQLKAHYSHDLAAVNNHINRCKQLEVDAGNTCEFVRFDVWSNQDTFALMRKVQATTTERGVKRELEDIN
eukprot:3977630-Amphidinium_carterae.1